MRIFYNNIFDIDLNRNINEKKMFKIYFVKVSRYTD